MTAAAHAMAAQATRFASDQARAGAAFSGLRHRHG
jgi:hypothetical protein